jgi:hypothetical protein
MRGYFAVGVIVGIVLTGLWMAGLHWFERVRPSEEYECRFITTGPQRRVEIVVGHWDGSGIATDDGRRIPANRVLYCDPVGGHS